MKYKKAARNRFRFARVEYRDIFTGCDVLDEFDVSWAGMIDNFLFRRRVPLIARGSNIKRMVRDNWKRKYRGRFHWDN